jgi:hypothetical protein
MDLPPRPPPLQRSSRVVYDPVDDLVAQLRPSGVSRDAVRGVLSQIRDLTIPERTHLANRLKSEFVIPQDVNRMLEGRRKSRRRKRGGRITRKY